MHISLVEILQVAVLVVGLSKVAVTVFLLGTWRIVMHAPARDVIEGLLGSAKYVQSIVYRDVGMRDLDAL